MDTHLNPLSQVSNFKFRSYQNFRGYQPECVKLWGYLNLGVPSPVCAQGVPLYLGVPRIFGGTFNPVTSHDRPLTYLRYIQIPR